MEAVQNRHEKTLETSEGLRTFAVTYWVGTLRLSTSSTIHSGLWGKTAQDNFVFFFFNKIKIYVAVFFMFPMLRNLIKFSRRIMQYFYPFFCSKLRRSWTIMRNSTPKLCSCADRSYRRWMYRPKLSWRLKLGLCRKPGSKVMVWLWRGKLSLKLSLK